jgi:hypothetical protein
VAAREQMAAWCPVSTRRHVPLLRSQTCTPPPLLLTPALPPLALLPRRCLHGAGGGEGLHADVAVSAAREQVLLEGVEPEAEDHAVAALVALQRLLRAAPARTLRHSPAARPAFPSSSHKGSASATVDAPSSSGVKALLCRQRLRQPLPSAPSSHQPRALR